MPIFGRGKTGNGASKTSAKQGGGKGGAKISRVRIDSGYYNVGALDGKRLTINGIDRDFIKGQRLHFSFVIDVDGEEVEVPTQGTVLGTNGSQVLASFMAPQPYYQRFLRQAATRHANPPQRR